MRQSKSTLLSVMNSLRKILLLLRDLVLNRAIFKDFCFEIGVGDLGIGRRLIAFTWGLF